MSQRIVISALFLVSHSHSQDSHLGAFKTLNFSGQRCSQAALAYLHLMPEGWETCDIHNVKWCEFSKLPFLWSGKLLCERYSYSTMKKRHTTRRDEKDKMNTPPWQVAWFTEENRKGERNKEVSWKDPLDMQRLAVSFLGSMAGHFHRGSFQP